MKTKLMPTQAADVITITAGQDIPNFSEPGTGKTLNTIACIEAAKLQKGLIVCPTIATMMWTRLLASELGARTQHLATRTTKIDPLADFLVASYGVIEAHQSKLICQLNDALVIDESHYIKNRTAQRTKVLMGENTDGDNGLYCTSSQCWLLTGTPIERYADDLWSQLRATQPEALQKYGALDIKQFQLQFCKMEWKEYANGRVKKYISTGNQATSLLNELLYKEIGVVRRTMREVDPYMPEATEREIFTRHEDIAELLSLLKGLSKEQIAKELLAGSQNMVTARRLMGMAKLRSGIDYVKMQSREAPVLVGYWHDDVGKEIYKQLTASSYAANLISGSTSPEARERIRKRFIAGELNALVGQIQAMGVAMDGLQETCHHAIVFENDWSHAKIEQFYKRLARKGQGEHTQVDFLKCSLDLEDVIDDIRKKKRVGTLEIVG